MSARGESKVLILEEHAGRRMALVHMLGRLGFPCVTEAHDGQTGLDLVRSSLYGYDLIVCNLDMSGMDGLEFIRHASRLGVGGLILYAVHDDAVLSSAEWMARAYKAPLFGVLRVPFTRADLEPLVAKLHGNFTVYSDVVASTPRASETDRAVIDELRTALDLGQFVPHYQPKVCLATGDLLGAEALARWQHPELGLLAPSHFVDLMESSDLIDPLTHQVLAQAARDVVAWRRVGLDIAVSINLCPLSLERPDCAKELLATIAEAGAQPASITFEITEKAFAKDATAVLENVLRLRMRGCGIAVDDFGTGYSSLQQLNRTPITELKLDRSFVRRVMSNAKASSIVESTIDLATRLKLKTVAEGIATEAQRDRLAALGCDMGQGFLFAKAMDSQALLRWWQSRRRIAA